METVQPIRNVEDIELMKKYLSPRDCFMFTLGINVGVRISDILPLKVKDVAHRSHLLITEKKTKKKKRFLINDSLQSVIAAYCKGKEPEDLLFPSRKGDQPISRVQAYRVLNSAAEEIGLEEIGTHTLRKTFGYHFYKRTGDIAMLQELFNHASQKITLRYIGMSQDTMDDAVRDFSL
jgi:integrase